MSAPEKSKKQNTAPPHAPKAGSRRLSPYVRGLVFIILLGALLRALYFAELVKSPYFSHPAADASFHDYWARGLATGAWKLREEGPSPRLDRLPFLRPPGYSYFLALIYRLAGPGDRAPRLVQMTLGLLNIALAFALGRLLFGPAVGLVFAALMAVCWNFIYFEGELQPPVLLISIGLILMYLLTRWAEKPARRLAFASGVVLGLFALIRPNVLVFAPVLAIWLWRLARCEKGRRPGWQNAGAMLGAAALTVAPATLRNYFVAGEFVVISCNGPVNFYVGNNPSSDGVTPKIPELKELTGLTRWSWLDYESIVRGVQRRSGRKMNFSDVSAYFNHKALSFIENHPLACLRLMAKRAILFWGPDEVSNNKVIYMDRRASAVLRSLPGFPTALSLSLLGLLMLFQAVRRHRKESDPLQHPARFSVHASILILLFVLSYFASYLPFLVAERFRVPLIPFLLLFGAYGIHRLGGHLIAHRYRRGAAWAIVWVSFFAFASHSWIRYEPDLSWWHYDRGGAFQQSGNFAKAVEEYKAALWCGPDHVEIHYDMATALSKLDRLEEAVEQYRKAIALRPNMIAAYNNLGIVLARLKRYDEAERVLREALLRDPNDALVHRNLGTVLLNLHRPGEAAKEYREALRLNPADTEAQTMLDGIKP